MINFTTSNFYSEIRTCKVFPRAVDTGSARKGATPPFVKITKLKSFAQKLL